MVEKAFGDCDNFYRLDRHYRICFYARRKHLCETPALPVSECDKAENATHPMWAARGMPLLTLNSISHRKKSCHAKQAC